MAETSKDYELFHYGVKGMRWGVRRKTDGDGLAVGSPPGKSSRAERKVAKQDQKFEKKARSVGTFIEVNNRAADIVNNTVIPKINGKKEYADASARGDLAKDTPINRKYEKEFAREYSKALNEAASSIGTNASGTRKYRVELADDLTWSVYTDEVSHASSPTKVRPKRDSKGFIIGIEPVKDEIKHSDSVSSLRLFGRA